jgi:hypothetical protein
MQDGLLPRGLPVFLTHEKPAGVGSKMTHQDPNDLPWLIAAALITLGLVGYPSGRTD